MHTAAIKSLRCFFVPLFASVVCSHASDVAPPKNRELAVAEAKAFVASRSSVPELPKPIKNPFLKANSQTFQSNADEALEEASSQAGASAQEVNQQDKLGVLAGLVPATGAIKLSGNPLLLLGQNRYRVGDSLNVTFESKEYSLQITEINLVSFTVKLGDNYFTRPIRLRSNN